jgi:hypothetical protein
MTRTACAAKLFTVADARDSRRLLAQTPATSRFVTPPIFLQVAMTMQNTTLNEAISAIRIQPRHIDAMIREMAASIGDHRLEDRLRGEPGFHLKAVDLTQGLVIAMTLAQTLRPEEKFAAMMGPDRFAGGDACLEKLGGAMLEQMLLAPRLGNELVPEETLQDRSRTIRQWV